MHIYMHTFARIYSHIGTFTYPATHIQHTYTHVHTYTSLHSHSHSHIHKRIYTPRQGLQDDNGQLPSLQLGDRQRRLRHGDRDDYCTHTHVHTETPTYIHIETQNRTCNKKKKYNQIPNLDSKSQSASKPAEDADDHEAVPASYLDVPNIASSAPHRGRPRPKGGGGKETGQLPKTVKKHRHPGRLQTSYRGGSEEQVTYIHIHVHTMHPRRL
jgi:hypothetical protein